MTTLSPRALNRAMLARQLLLRRSHLGVLDAVRHLAGLQAQSPWPPYYALWTRLHGFRPEQLSELLVNREVVRIVLMRGTVHLVDAADGLAWRPVVQPLLDRDLATNTQHAAKAAGLDLAEVAGHARELLAGEPLTAGRLGERLALRWPGRPPSTLAHIARNLLPLVQVPPRGVWGRSGQTTYATAQDWLGRPLAPPDPAALVLRYLAAFGPASVLDVQTWCGLTRLGEVVEGLDLRTFRDEAGRTLYDLPDADRPDPDTPAPPRFLGGFDQTLLSYADRTRVISDEYRRRIFTKNGLIPQAVLCDGVVRGVWRIERAGDSATLTVTEFARMSTKDRTALTSAGARLLRFAEPSAVHDIRFVAEY
ncbi:winged helix DNA-binding domain-containing protein [Amycolatopsis suaedae]|uniref:Winged helix DNA-binding domain-containing protein n=1 Tax=Amycolatopsis suaedae TaxID=2510978 RepID=A0A4V2ELL7_9PSEU|nr:winged helix DNA-binding domain-containing protein [Amycolatopsis suaedae]RZQ62005.1 winged helix DNA-binding domain-containing protein [Amycolatopsis suaedae]